MNISELETVQAIAVEPYFVHAARAKLNKNSHLAEYSKQVSNGDYNTQLYQVRWHVHLTNSQYKVLADNLLTDFDWLAGKGGSDSTTAPRGGVDDWADDYTEAEQEQWRKGAYDICLLVMSPIGRMVIDPEGHTYARYVGIDITPVEATETIPEAIAPQIEPELTSLRAKATEILKGCFAIG